eukprot:NODE_36_length_1985_cov_771.490186_g32_i0.p1 GENE.NODE_36_length_1985_cov_771.490186_g32_i0~~NODE_36_length_1985_cov_771.490186_g32_i0.p1  ORF type:complete len:272 (-),score=28.65 NODE_36_length_1985_cov_771.490186_g32_i0:478-1293(-)
MIGPTQFLVMYALTYVGKQTRDPTIQRNSLINDWTNTGVLLLMVCFMFFSLKSFEQFDCTNRADGQRTMDAVPAIVCGSSDSEWAAMLPFSICFIIFYAAVAFGACAKVAKKAKIEWNHSYNPVKQALASVYCVHVHRARIPKLVFELRYNSLWKNYADDFFWWELFDQLRKLLTASTQMGAGGTRPVTVAIFSLVLQVFALGLCCVFQPYRKTKSNVIYAICLLAVAVMSLAAVLFGVLPRSKGVTIGILVLLGLFAVCIIVAFFQVFVR